MRISDWSSDVCASDLGRCRGSPVGSENRLDGRPARYDGAEDRGWGQDETQWPAVCQRGEENCRRRKRDDEITSLDAPYLLGLDRCPDEKEDEIDGNAVGQDREAGQIGREHV